MRAALALAAVVTLAGPAAAEPGASEAMNEYFAGEKRGGWILGGMGAVGIGTGGVLLGATDSDLAHGVAYATLGIGVIHVAAGVFVTVTSNSRIDKFTDEISQDERAFAARERERIIGVERQFFALKIVEGVLIAGGTGAFVYGLRADRDHLAGIGLGIAIEAAATLVFDIVAARRAARYRGALEAIAIQDASGALGPGLGIRLTFQ